MPIHENSRKTSLGADSSVLPDGFRNVHKLRPELIAVLEEQTTRTQTNEIFSKREELIRSSLDSCQELCDELSRKFSSRLADPDYNQIDLKNGETRDLHLRFWQSLPLETQELYFSGGISPEDQQTQLFQMLGRSWNKLKGFPKNDTTQIIMRTRGVLDGKSLSYGVHPILELPYLMEAFQLAPSLLDKLISAFHDYAEEGRELISCDGEIQLRVLDTEELKTRFPENRLGEIVALTTPVLTESELEEMVSEVDIDGFALRVREALSSSHYSSEEREIMNRYFSEKILTFGTLARQVGKVFQEFLRGDSPGQFSPELLRDISFGIMKVELVDRISEATQLERYVRWNRERPVRARTYVLASSCKLLGLYELLQEGFERGVQSERGFEGTEFFKNGFQGYLSALHVGLERANRELESLGMELVPLEEVLSLYEASVRDLFAVGQEAVRLHVEKKLRRVIGG